MNKTTNREENNEDNVPFNMSMLFYLRLSKLMEFKDQSAIYGNFIDWHRSLSAIFRTVHFSIDKKSSENIEELLKISKSYLFIKPNKMITSKLENNLSEADKLLMIAMDKKGMIFPNIETSVGLSSLKKRYNIGLENEKI